MTANNLNTPAKNAEWALAKITSEYYDEPDETLQNNVLSPSNNSLSPMEVLKGEMRKEAGKITGASEGKFRMNKLICLIFDISHF